MKKKRIETIDRIAAAYLRGQGDTQDRIHEILGISQSSVARALDETKGIYWQEECRFLTERFEEDQPEGLSMRDVHQRVGRFRLAAKLAAHCGLAEEDMPEIRVFPCGLPGKVVWDERVTNLGRAAAGVVNQLLLNGGICGLTWGRHVQSVVAGVEKISAPSSSGQPELRVLPLCGDSTLRPIPSDQSSAVLAMRLDQAMNGKGHVTPSLASVPAFIPKNFSKQEVAAVRKLINLNPDYVEIFGKAGAKRVKGTPLIHDVSMILTGVGPAVRRGGKSGHFFKAAGVDLDRLSRLVIGDISAYFIERPDLKPHEKEQVKKINSLWTGLHREDLQRCSDAARSSNGERPGVVIAAAGEDRAEVMVEIARQRLSQLWLIDNTLEARVIELVSGSE